MERIGYSFRWRIDECLSSRVGIVDTFRRILSDREDGGWDENKAILDPRRHSPRDFPVSDFRCFLLPFRWDTDTLA